MGQVILLAQQKGGAGKTTLLTQLAVHFAAEGRSVHVIDLDPQRSASGWHRTRSEALVDGGGITLAEGAEWRAGTDMKAAARENDVVLVDAPGSADSLGRGAMRAADFALIPCQPSMADLWASEATLKMADEAGIPHAVVLNRMPWRSRAAGAVVDRLTETGAPVLGPTLGPRSAFVEAFMMGGGVTEILPRSKAADEVRALAAALADQLQLSGRIRELTEGRTVPA